MYDAQVNGKGRIVPVRIEPDSDISTDGLQDEYALPVKDLPKVLWQRLWIIALVAVVLAGSVVGFDLLQTPSYESSIKILIGQEGSTQGNLQGEVMGLQQITQTMSEAVETRPVAEAVIRELDLALSPEDFLENLSVKQVRATQFIEVTYQGASPEEARQIANTVGGVFSEQVSEISPSDNPITATVWEQAATPEAPVSPNPLRDGAVALLIGGMLGISLAFLLEHLDDRWRSPEEVEQVSGVPTFGVIPELKFSKSSDLPERPERLVTFLDPTDPASETYRTLRTSLLYSLVDTSPKVIVLTSPGPEEGKSTTCANLGVVLAQADKNVIILDCDFRRPALHKIFELRNFGGITNVLAGERSPQEVWQEPLPGLKVITVGPLPPNPAELLGSRRTAEFIRQLRLQFDYVLIDAPPTELISDSVILASQGDGVLLVLDAQNTPKGSVRKAMRNLEAVGANVLGTVMNNVKASKGGYYYNYTYK